MRFWGRLFLAESDTYCVRLNLDKSHVRDIYCFTKSDLFSFIRSDGSVGIANFKTKEIVAKLFLQSLIHMLSNSIWNKTFMN